MTVGGRGEKLRPAEAPPISEVSSSLTILTTCWPGLSWRWTSMPRARSLTVPVNCLTTLKFTSASSRARRISRIAREMSSSVRTPRWRTPASVPWSLSARESNILSHCTRPTAHALSGLSARRSSLAAVRVLVVEDDARMAAAISRGLRYEGLVVDVAADGHEALAKLGAIEYEAVVLDLMLPGMDGVETCRRLREGAHWVPVLMLTARDAIEDRVRGLDGGADDYLIKPFSLAELLARLRALVRRGPVDRPSVLEVGDLRLDPASHEVRRGHEEVELSPREFALLETFMRRPGQVFTQLQLLEAVWDLGYEQRSNVVEVYVRYLREKLDRPFGVSS